MKSETLCHQSNSLAVTAVSYVSYRNLKEFNAYVFFFSDFLLPWWLRSKESACNAGDLGSIPGSGRSLGGGHRNPLQTKSDDLEYIGLYPMKGLDLQFLLVTLLIAAHCIIFYVTCFRRLFLTLPNV